MTLPTSGILSLNEINTEFSRGTDLFSYRGTSWSKDDGSSGNFSSGLISINDFLGTKLPASVSAVNPLPFNGASYTAEDFASITAIIILSIQSDGIYTIDGEYSNSLSLPVSGAWLSPSSVGNMNLANGYYVRFTRTSETVGGIGGVGSALSSPSTGWLSLGGGVTGRSVSVTASAAVNSKYCAADYFVEISDNSAGTNILSSGTISLTAVGSAYGSIP